VRSIDHPRDDANIGAIPQTTARSRKQWRVPSIIRAIPQTPPTIVMRSPAGRIDAYMTATPMPGTRRNAMALRHGASDAPPSQAARAR
jgi:hypothetical protein